MVRMTTLAKQLTEIEEADAEIDALNRGPGPVHLLLPVLVARSNAQRRALDNALAQLASRGGADVDLRDEMRLHGRLRALAEMDEPR
ncbi:MAG: hypothetical protein ABWZ77_05135 [Naasia sp.]